MCSFLKVKVRMIDSLPPPFGWVLYGAKPALGNDIRYRWSGWQKWYAKQVVEDSMLSTLWKPYAISQWQYGAQAFCEKSLHHKKDS
jgi:hypothetical protein